MMRLGAASENVLLMYWALAAMLATLLLSCPSSFFLLYPVSFVSSMPSLLPPG